MARYLRAKNHDENSVKLVHKLDYIFSTGKTDCLLTWNTKNFDYQLIYRVTLRRNWRKGDMVYWNRLEHRVLQRKVGYGRNNWKEGKRRAFRKASRWYLSRRSFLASHFFFLRRNGHRVFNAISLRRRDKNWSWKFSKWFIDFHLGNLMEDGKLGMSLTEVWVRFHWQDNRFVIIYE